MRFMFVNCESFCNDEGLFISDYSERGRGVWVFSAVDDTAHTCALSRPVYVINSKSTHSFTYTNLAAQKNESDGFLHDKLRL